MSVEENKAIARRWSAELWGRGNLAVADEIVAPDYVRHDPCAPFSARGPEDVKRLVTMLREMLPDLETVVEEVIADGDKVVSRYTTVATEGFMGRPPTGKVIRTPAIQIFRFAGGQDGRELGRARRPRDAAPTRSRPTTGFETRSNAELKQRKESTTLLWMNEYLMALHEVERARLASQERKNHRKESLPEREPADRDEQVYPPSNYSKEVTTCP